jgi:hypothetical protein
MSRNVQEPPKAVGELSQNIYCVSTAAEETIQGSNQTKDVANNIAVDFQGLICKFTM